MAEIAGLVLGGIPLAIWALEKYAEPFEAFHRYRTSIDTFRADLILQKWQLQTTLSNVGLHADPSTQELRECFETKYPEICPQLMSIIERMDEVTAALLKTLDLDVKGKPDALPEKFQWEWRRVKHSFTVKKRNKVVEDLRHWNEDLKRSLEKLEVPAQDDTRKVQDLKRRFNITRSDAIRQSLASFHRALEFGFHCTCSTPHQAAIDLDWAAYESDSAKTIKVAVSYKTSSQPQGLGSWCKLGITSETVVQTPEPALDLLTPSPPAPIRASSPNSLFRSTVAHFRLARSLSRSPPPPPASPTTTGPSPNPQVLEASVAVSTPANTEVTSLCAALCTESSRWPLIRFLKDPDEDKNRHYSLYHHPVDSKNIVKAITLKSLFSSREQQAQRRNPYLSLSAKQRFGIAATIAWSVLHLSCSPWLTEHWDQTQMGIFLEKTQNGREVLSRHPCASYVFSPRTCQEQATADDFSHLVPNFSHLVPNFSHLVPNRTVFALGILLIEFCISEPVSKSRQGEGVPTTLVDDYQSALSRLDEVYRLAGDSYGYATERCVKFSFEGRDVYNDFDVSRFRQQFYDAVVAPVQATYLAFPDSHHSV
ncbi:hypothetical protein QBC33DRAFT_548990 [Phialemonium atrogriseum]|uniref:DUF7580 domain-containing protein n=1 Tax=Phialemonium atrogriseum TaxID=1093897 RepID=A0AAJ0BX62_9PEZI|nr:uncharacterized protein QBC33DRAFT_548990 [Phialemonium atrogriseum]KAK1763701.1 hypothetical protein QBC33DRAFT_548990 [Phialemonium atrogriseum]